MAHVFQRPLNTRVAPVRILRGHPNNEPPNPSKHSRSPLSSPSVGPFLGNQFTMPSKNRIGRDERRHLTQCRAAEALPQHRETSPLRVVQPQPASSQLCFQRATLFAQECDHTALLALQLSEQREEEHLERNHGASLRQCVTSVFRHYEHDPVLGQYGFARSDRSSTNRRRSLRRGRVPAQTQSRPWIDGPRPVTTTAE